MDFKLPVMHKDTKPFLLGALAGAVLLGWVGFQLVGWKTGGASERLAKGQANAAVATALGKICSVQFNNAPNLPERLATLQKTEQWSRSGVVAKAGFATMPGEKEPANGVAEACANLLVPEKT
ncbi:MAG TPA: hypothetical protein VK642_04575 [Burkholderiales bacterium]|nr:hypothetical protein [Burkholderiales bacterium]